MNLKSIYYESLSIQILPDSSQIGYLSNQFYIHNVIYNTLLDKVLQDYSQTHTLQYDLKEWPDYIKSIFTNNPIYPGILVTADPIVIHGVFNELDRDLQYHLSINNMMTCPSYKTFDTSVYQSFWIDTQNLEKFKMDKISLELPGLGKVRINTIMSNSENNSRIIAIQVVGNLVQNVFQ